MDLLKPGIVTPCQKTTLPKSLAHGFCTNNICQANLTLKYSNEKMHAYKCMLLELIA